jgi:hypothetical protein
VSSRAGKKNVRKWARLQLSIPVFVRTQDGYEGSKAESLEFATAINISAGGAMVAVRRSLPKFTPVLLEIPSARVGPSDGGLNSPRLIKAKTVWVSHLNDYHLMGLKFARPLHTDAESSSRYERKAVSEV